MATTIGSSKMARGQRLQSTLDALLEHVAVLAPGGEILTVVNRSWQQFAVGSPHLQRPHRSAGRRPPELRGAHPFQSPTERRWFLMHVAPVSPLEQGGCVVTHFDVTGWIDPARIGTEPSS